MNVLEFTVAVGLGSVLAGFLGALTGLGGGVVIVPLLVLGFGVDIRYAIGASLVSVIATSSGAAAAYVQEGYSNIRVGMFLEIATTLGALSGAMLASRVPANGLAVVFGFVLLYIRICRGIDRQTGRAAVRPVGGPSRSALTPPIQQWRGKRVITYKRVPAGFGLMYAAGILSGLLGIGSGAVKALAMDHAMRLPFKVSTTTSNFMIGVTAAASAGVYLHRGYMNPGLAMPVMLGALLGSMQGAHFLAVAKTRWLRVVFTWVIVVLAVEMLYRGTAGKL